MHILLEALAGEHRGQGSQKNTRLRAMFPMLRGDHPALGPVKCASGYSDIFGQVCLPPAGKMVSLMKGRYCSEVIYGRGHQSAV